MGKLDALGRGTFHHIAPQDAVHPTNREGRWLKHIERHGPQSSVYLYELTRDSHRCKDTALRQLQKLRAGGFLFLPHQQRATERAEFNPYIYDLTQKAKRWLVDSGHSELTVRPTGHWWHAYQVACVTSSIDIVAADNGLRYIPAHDILARNGASLAIPMNGTKLIPDQLFALDYGGRYRAFVLEVDRGTEPKVSVAARKSLAESIDIYVRAQSEDRLRLTYGLKTPVIVLWVFDAKSRAAFALELLSRVPTAMRRAHLVQCVGSSLPERTVPTDYLHRPWERAALAPVFLAVPSCAGMQD